MNIFLALPGVALCFVGIAIGVYADIHIQGGYADAKAKAESILAPYPVDNQEYLSPAEHLEAMKSHYSENIYTEVKSQYDAEISPYADTGYNAVGWSLGFITPGMILIIAAQAIDLAKKAKEAKP